MKIVGWTGRALQGLRLLTGVAVLVGVGDARSAEPGRKTYVIHISMDGFRPDAVTVLGPTNLPHFYRLRREGAFTDNANSDYDITVTLPNHTCQLTGRGVMGPAGHNWSENDDPLENQTLASNKGSYIAGVFDVAHDAGLRTGFYASKSKFSLFINSWNETNGAPGGVGPNQGRNKIDVKVINETNTAELVSQLVADMDGEPFDYVFLHLMDPDAIGHSFGWDITPGSVYSDVAKAMDSRLGQILDLIDGNSRLSGQTAIIITADHGGGWFDHSIPTVPVNYTIPFYVWGPGVIAGADLYALNPRNRLAPAGSRRPYSDPVQPIRNGEAANTALRLLGLGPVPGSTINLAQDLNLTAAPPPPDFRLILSPPQQFLQFTTFPRVHYDVQCSDQWQAGSWSNCVTDILGTGAVTNVNVGPSSGSSRFYRLKLHF